MGLEITAYSKLTLDPTAPVDEDGSPVGPGVRFSGNHDAFDEHGEGLEFGKVYAFDEADDEFCSGYISYGIFRDQLAALAGYPPSIVTAHTTTRHAATVWERWTAGDKSGPFAWLINFTDCDGVIGPVVAAKVAAQFAEFQAEADAHTDAQFRTRYATLRAAFELAADGGAVEFH